jgi:hypothetical protein
MLTAICHFQVLGLWVNTEFLGTRETITYFGHKITLIYPEGQADFGINPHDSGLCTLGVYRYDFSEFSEFSDFTARDVLIIRAEIEVDEDPAAQISASVEHDAEPLYWQCTAILTESINIACAFVQEYLDLVRYQLGQHWLGPSAWQVRPTWLCELLDNEGNKLPAEYIVGFPIKDQFRDPQSVISRDVHTTLLRKISEGTKPKVAEILLNDAKYVGLESDHPDLRQAVLLAAIACEVKVKDVLTALASPDQKPILSRLLGNPRGRSMSAAALFDKGMDSICNRSLRKEDMTLYRNIEHLFQDRNKIAHKGGKGVSDDKVLRGHIKAATWAFVWLNELHVGKVQSSYKPVRGRSSRHWSVRFSPP